MKLVPIIAGYGRKKEAGRRLTSKIGLPTSNHKIYRKESLALKPAGKGRVLTNE
jgi:hypothetical protein